MKRLFSFLVAVVVLGAFGAPLTISAQQEDCSADAVQVASGDDWIRFGAQIFTEYEGAVQIEGDAQRAAALQALRRCLENQAHPDDQDAAYESLRDSLIIAVDSIISMQLGNTEASIRYAAEVESLREALRPEFGVVESTRSSDSTGIIATIDLPTDGAVVDMLTQVGGSYDASQINANQQVWLVLKTEDQLIFPASDDPCGARVHLPSDPAGGNRWALTIGVGSADSVGAYTLMLILTTAEQNGVFNQWLDESCASNWTTPPLNDTNLMAGSFLLLQQITVIRQ
ncbi:MAG: hypothetical protein U0670_02130 [Anaerolineae bacterium]